MLDPLHNVVTALSGQQALDILDRDQEYDVVSCDLLMPKMTGVELFEKVNEKYPELAKKFIFMTGGVFTPRISELVEQVKNPKLNKPMELEGLLQIIDDAITGIEPVEV